ncbi:hypothetical protein AN639_08575 [Candidatus Epulonipiscium fishelsonii]|uniref:Uncharacterized protein n=1 Tax=Candidatus Epulonipiscium fishelsonii TaxID=77094 RepID=A0ACC8X9I5_9FIRM|nr:hypothetical protein AN639_08575 [Epulopiscium sp. SCG-B05WGA-EpuloA1]ONI38791.1 hypothetical protein AN396_09915 [Epulopiscium sp. SCG-B11WGA-EpuloA1]
MIFKSDLEDNLATCYKDSTGRDINFQNPQTFNEKMQWCKLYDNNPLKTKLSDKYEVRKWIANKIGKKYLIDSIGIYENFNEIEWNNLPQQFVIKTTHGWDQNIIVKDKNIFDKNKAKLQIEKWLNYNFFKLSLEMQYKDIKPRIIIEKYIENFDNQLYDYKFWCFNGKVEYIMFIGKQDPSDITRIFFNREWERQPFTFNAKLKEIEIPKPDNLNEMIEIAEILSKEFPHVRVDLYSLNNGEIKFGEMTFTTHSGVAEWNLPEIDLKLGQLFNIEPLKDKLTNQYNNSKVIFFTPIYNAINTIERAYKSLANQTDKNWIWHVVDDASTDGTYELLQKLSNEDNRIILHRNKVNNVIDEGNDIVDIGVMYSDIDYFAVLDADDEYMSDFIEDCKTYAIANNLDMVVVGREDSVDGKYINRSMMNKYLILTKAEKERDFLKWLKCMGTYWGKLFKISTLKKINRDNLIYQHVNGHDAAFAIEMFRKATNIGILNKAYYRYYIYPNSKLRTWRKGRIEAYAKIGDLMEQYLLEYKDIISATNKKVIQFYCVGMMLSAVEALLKADLSEHEKQQEFLKIGRVKYIKELMADEGFDEWCNNLSGQKDIKKNCFTLIKDWMLSQTDIEDDLILEFCETGQLFCASMNDEEGWLQFKILHANALIELGNNMIEQGEQEIQELEKILNI